MHRRLPLVIFDTTTTTIAAEKKNAQTQWEASAASEMADVRI